MPADLHAEIWEWMRGRPPWQQEAYQRLATGETLSDQDIRELTDRLVRGDKEDQWQHLPSEASPFHGPTAADNEAVVINHVQVERHVNGLLDGQKLMFAPENLTVIYGENGSGKSGFARLLKRAAQARVHEAVLGPVFTSSVDATPEATISAKIGDRTLCFKWTDPPPELRQVHYFDASCGEKYLSDVTPINYRPTELITLDHLGEVCDKIADLLRKSRTANEIRAISLPEVHQDQKSAQFLATLRELPSTEQINALCERPRRISEILERLTNYSMHLRTTDPIMEKTKYVQYQDSLNELAMHLENLYAKLGQAALAKLSEELQRSVDTRQAERAALSSQFNDAPLSGIGEREWQLLWDAAREFANTHAYQNTNDQFPHVGDGARCVLCMQELSEETKDRFARFEDAIASQLSRQAEVAEQVIMSRIENLQTVSISTEATQRAFAILESDEGELVANMREELAHLANIRQAAIEKNIERVRELTQIRHEDLTGTLRAASKRYGNAADAIKETTHASLIKMVDAKKAMLEDRQRIHQSREAIIEEVDRLGEHSRIVKALNLVDRGPLTKKANELTRAHVTNKMNSYFVDAAIALRVDRIALRPTEARKGQSYDKVAISGVETKVEPVQMLSDGEQGVIGLARYLTEVAFDSNNAPLVLDDPVTSLDHRNRTRIAQYLVGFAETRQVIVFTHDVAFLAALTQATEGTKVTVEKRSLERTPLHLVPGRVSDEHPWTSHDIGSRFDRLAKSIVSYRSPSDDSTERELEMQAAEWAGELRETLKRIVRSFTRKVVDPGSLHVSPAKIRAFAQFTDKDNSDFQRIYRRASRWARCHDIDPLDSYVRPTADEMEEMREQAQAWWKRIQKYAG